MQKTLSEDKDLLKFWDYSKNSKNPETLSLGSNYKAWWICNNGHSFQQLVSSRTKYSKNDYCPYCSGKKVLSGFNDLATTHPESLKNWDYNKNTISPKDVQATSIKKVWWICDKGHNYEQRIKNNVLIKNKCSYCSGKKVAVGENDFASQYPEFLKYWDYNKNTIQPNEITYGSNKKVWWICDKGHSFEKVINGIWKDQKICYYCSGAKILAGYNDISTTHPGIAKWWDYDKNTENIENIIAGTNKKIWWLCDKGHSFSMVGSERIKYPDDYCVYCNGGKVLQGVNDLATTHPGIAKQWDYEKNKFPPSKYKFGSDHKAWWLCNKGHSYQQSIGNKTRKNYGCPYCINRKIIAGENDVATTHPYILEIWDYDKNKCLPTEVSYGSGKKYWFKCKKKSHSYQQSLCDKIGKGYGCPKCTGTPYSKSEKEVFDYVKSLLPDIEIIGNNRNVLKNSELDIYIPEKKVAIEFNGLYWHTENQGKDKWYHYNKWKECIDNNIQLITIWEDDWIYRKEIVKNMLARKLHVSNEQKIAARKTFVDMISKEEASSFCETNHIQGFNLGTYYIGLRDKKDNSLVAVSIWRKNKQDIYLDRYCTSQIVQGGMGKLLKYALEVFKNDGFTQLITFADHAVSDGGLYEQLGFLRDSELKPDYSYYYNHKRRHKFGFRKKRFRNDPELLYKDNMTEKELADLNEIYRIWDCGKTRYTIPVKPISSSEENAVDNANIVNKTNINNANNKIDKTKNDNISQSVSSTIFSSLAIFTVLSHTHNSNDNNVNKN